MKTLWMVLCAALALSVCAPVRAAAPPQAAGSFDALLPDDTVLYMSVSDLPGLLAKLKESEGYKIVKELKLFERLAPPEDYAKMQEFYTTYIEPLGGIFSGQVAFALTKVDAGNGGKPELVLLADVSKSEAALNTFLEKTIHPLVTKEGAAPEQVEVGGVTYTKLLPDPQDPNSPLFYTVHDGVLMVSLSTETISSLITPPAKTLAGNAWYADVKRALAGSDVQVYFNAGMFIQKGIEEGPEEAAAWMEAFGLDKLRGIGFGSAMGPGGGDATVRLATDGAPAGLLGAFAKAGGPIDSLAYVPGDAGFYYVLNFESLKAIYDQFATTLQSVSEKLATDSFEQFTAGIGQIETVLGMKLDDVLASFGGEIAVYAKIPEALGIPPAAVLIEIKDKAKVEQFVARVLELLGSADEAVKTTTTTYGTTEITTVLAAPQITPGVAVLDRFLVISTHPDVIRSVIDTAAKGPNLGANEQYRAATAGLPGEPVGLMYVDLKGLYEFVFPLIAASVHPPERLEGLFADLGGLGEHLSGVGITLTADASGFTYRKHSKSALLEPGLLVGAGMVLPAIARARESARSAASISNVRQVAMAIEMYATDHDGQMPTKLSDLVPEYIDSAAVFVSPNSNTKASLIDLDKPETIDQNSDYELVLTGKLSDVDDLEMTPMIREKQQFSKRGLVVGYADGHVEAVHGKGDTVAPDTKAPEAPGGGDE
jgi:hypothetical protein